MLNWIVRNRSVWYLTVCKQKTVFILNWFVWNKTIYMYKMNLAVNNLH